MIFFFVYIRALLAFIRVPLPPDVFSFSGFYNQRMPCGCMDFNAIKACVFFLFSGEEDEQC